MRLHKEGFRIIPVVGMVLILMNLATWLAARGSPIFYILLVITSLFFIMTIWFFRDPLVKAEARPGELLSPADGKVVVAEPVVETEYFNDERLQISVFMSVFNVHINHVPVAGEIVYQKHHPGRFMPASLAKSSGENERCTTVIRTPDGTEIMIRQIAGLLARRVVTYKKTGEKISLRDQLGFIRFGSRVDLILPPGTSVKVKPGQKVRGAVSVLGVYN